MDVFGREDRFDMQNLNLVNDPSRNLSAHRNYARKIPADYKTAYHNAVEEGFGFNIMDSLAKVFKAKDLDKIHPDLFSKIIKYRDILMEKSAPIQEIITSSDIKNSTKTKVLPIILGSVILASIGTFFGVKQYQKSKQTQKNE